MTLDETDAASETGQVTVVRTTVSVTRTVERASGGRVVRSSGLAGQSVMVAAHEVIVRTDVVLTVMVVTPPVVPFPKEELGAVVGKALAE
jgi:hypothetical protein